MNVLVIVKAATFVCMKFPLWLSFFVLCFLSACSPAKQIGKSAKEKVLHDPALETAHVGISLYEPATGKYWYNYQGEKYFVPASNTKLPTCYAAMKYLGDSLVGLRYGIPEEKWFKENVLVFQPAGDPTFLHEDYKQQPVFDFLKANLSHKKPGFLFNLLNEVDQWGSGWSWNDYQESYMAERSIFPIFGNVIKIKLDDSVNRLYGNPMSKYKEIGKPFKTPSSYFDSIIDKAFKPVSLGDVRNGNLSISRDFYQNKFTIYGRGRKFTEVNVPFITNGTSTVFEILSDTFKTNFSYVQKIGAKDEYALVSDDESFDKFHIDHWNTIHSQPTDSLLKPMMHRSDNFFAEQSLLMVSNERLGYMNDAKIIDTLLKTDFKDLPQKPRWVDGSGLSRYNLFTPQDMVTILNKMKAEFGMPRVQNILATGNEGTLSNYYVAEKGFIYAKTGTLSGVVAISGFLYTKKNKLLIFSVLVNNHQASATAVRRAVERFIEGIRERY
jgi:D-alanyl-D-alanine carboxypeptidase/D-alanyl-D-alanine-endopeptidase (penicillin-binding protein 4)